MGKARATKGVAFLYLEKICLSKTTQKAYVADHGEYNEKGDFEELLKYFLEFLW
ncbi:MAG: hypothetical protein IJN92_04435 [Lachnospiraceae bacterium]|nr:hypothetical protein [Lachnospiraceae bacterium]